MRTIPSGLLAHLQGSAVTPALLIAITRADGLVMGFTNADQNIIYGGVTFEATDGMGTTAVQQTAGTGVDNLDISGALSSARISAADLSGGLYDDAGLTMQLINRKSPGDGAALLFSGYLGQITEEDGEFKAEVRSLSQRLKQVVGEVTCATCRAKRLGDLQCKLDLTGTINAGVLGNVPIQVSKAVTSVVDLLNIQFNCGWRDGQGTNGTLKFTSGLNNGIERDIKIHTQPGGVGNDLMTLRLPFPYAVHVGDTAAIVSGCDRTFAVCVVTFNNGANFHGEEALPTNDVTMQTGK